MTSPVDPPQPQQPPQRGGGGLSLGLTAVVLLAISAGVVFWAGLSLGGQTTGRTADERAAVEAFSETYRIITDKYIGTPAPEELLEGAIDGMFEVLDDPHSRYMRPDEYAAALGDARGEFEGIGAVMATEDGAGEACDAISAECRLRVLEVLLDAPAEEAGLLAGDIVTGVDGEPLEGSSIDDSVRLIRGPRGTDVTLTLERDGGERELVITRDKIISEDIHSALLADGEVGYLAISNFSLRSADDFEEALGAHLDAGIDDLIVDLRGDPGGFVDAAVEISSQFLADGAVFWEEDAAGRQVAVDVSGGGLAGDPAIEVVMLVDGGSASASEILAGALQDAGRARLVGERTFGKGTVQEWTELPGENGGFRLSVAAGLTRDKTWIDGVGLVPDVPVAGTGERYRADAAEADPALDDQLQHAIALVLSRPPPSPAPTATGETAASPSPWPAASSLPSPLPSPLSSAAD